ncbi:MAG: hypothetical protein IT514_03355 [Burkholderiales bacterium]|nr:hypothetical protein [Burkholderiales bacterium]
MKGSGLLLLCNDTDPDVESEYERWHARAAALPGAEAILREASAAARIERGPCHALAHLVEAVQGVARRRFC